MSITHVSPPVRTKHPLTLNQVSRLTGRTLDQIHEAVRTGKLRLTTFFERKHRVTQSDLEAWLRLEGMFAERGVDDGDQ